MNDDKKKSIIKEALTDYNEIIEAASVNAKQKLAEEFPEKFKKILKEELNNKSKTEIDGDDIENNIDESKKQKESVMKKTKKEIKESINENPELDNTEVQPDEFDITELDIDSAGTALENADNDDEIITMDEIENEIANMEDLDGEINEIFGGSLTKEIEALDANDDANVNKVFNKAFKNILTNPKMGIIGRIATKTPIAKKYSILKQYAQNNGGTLRTTNGNTELAYAGKDVQGAATSFAAKGRSRLGEEEDLNEILGLGIKEKFANLDSNDEAGINKLFNAAFRDILANPKMGLIKRIAEKTPIEKKYNLLKQYVENAGGTLRTTNNNTELAFAGKDIKGAATSFAAKGRSRLGEEENEEISYDELLEMRNKLDEVINSMTNSEENEDFDDNNEEDLTSDDLDAIMYSDSDNDNNGEDDEEEIDEMHGVDYAKRRNMTSRGHNPEPEYLSSIEKDQSPEQFQESKAKIDSLIRENKKLTKKLNESKKFKTSATELIESYKNALGKYRNQLKDMAVFNSNLAHVNNLLVNEELALTQEDKINVINDFKKITTITESQEKYKSLLSEMKNTKKAISENIEDKMTVSTSIQSSSKQKLDEVVEKTVYENDEHIKKMRRLIEYTENRGKRII